LLWLAGSELALRLPSGGYFFIHPGAMVLKISLIRKSLDN
jgi:hypothetical protein